MSFQDVGRSTSNNNRAQVPGHERTTVGSLKPSFGDSAKNRMSPLPSIGESSTISNTSDVIGRDVSDAILQYQRNVVILESISKALTQGRSKRPFSARAEEEGDLKQHQYKIQAGVVSELGAKIEDLLKRCETKLSTLSSRTQTERARNALLKLTRDYRTVQARYQNIALGYRQRQSIEQGQLVEFETEQASSAQRQDESRKRQLQIREEEEKINLQIMREREEEVRKINAGVHTINQIYKVRALNLFRYHSPRHTLADIQG
jgi:hypothetical protein